MHRVGIMGGTFDPIHYGHLAAAEMARVEFTLDKVIFIPTGISPHKDQRGITEAEVRCAMVARAIEDNEHFVLSRIELDRKGPSYTVETLEELSENHPDWEMYFITGADAFQQIFTWREPHEILELAHVIGVSRPGFERSGAFLEQASTDRKIDANKVHFIEIPALAISSTDIRQRVVKGQTIRYLLPETVRQMILEKELYTTR